MTPINGEKKDEKMVKKENVKILILIYNAQDTNCGAYHVYIISW